MLRDIDPFLATDCDREKFLVNELYRLLDEHIQEKHILSFLQDFGVISDNCYKIFHVDNDYEAYKFILRNIHEFKKWCE